MEKMDFEKVYAVYDSLFKAFHEFTEEELNSEEGVELNSNMLSLWTLFLTLSGWKEDDFWDQLNSKIDSEDSESDLDINGFKSKIDNKNILN